MPLATLVLAIAFVACAKTAVLPPPAPLGTIDIDVKDMPIHDAVRLVATSGWLNIGLDPDVEGTVTLRFRAAPTRVVLDAIVAQHDLKITPMGKALRISRSSTPVVAQVFTGAPIAIDFTDAPIRDVASVFAAHAKVAIVVDADVEASVTQRMKDMPWDQALDHITRKYGLQVVKSGDTLRIAKLN
jgi:type II secretory pathway component HofQ